MSKYHTFWPRFWAGLIDGLVFVPLMFIDAHIESPDQGRSLFLAWTLLSTLSYFAYSVLLHWRYGQTLGKRLCKVKVLDISETRTPTFRQALMRDSGYIAMEMVGLVHLFVLVLSSQFSPETAYTQGLGMLLNWALIIWVFTELATMLTNNKRRALHDFIAKTVIVRVA